MIEENKSRAQSRTEPQFSDSTPSQHQSHINSRIKRTANLNKTCSITQSIKYLKIEEKNQLVECVDNLGDLLSKANNNQLTQLKKKYRFYLNKLQKLQQLNKELQGKYSGLEDLVQNSAPIKQQRKSIFFIQMISAEASKKLEKLMGKVDKAKQQKKIYLKKIEQLKQVIKKQKSNFFQLKRVILKLKNDKQNLEKTNELQSAQSTFKNIITNKINKKKQIINNQSLRLSNINKNKLSIPQRLNNFGPQIKQVKDGYKNIQLPTLYYKSQKNNPNHYKNISCDPIQFNKIQKYQNQLQKQLIIQTIEKGKKNFTTPNLLTLQQNQISSFKQYLYEQTEKNGQKNKNKSNLISIKLNKICQMKEQLLSESSKFESSILNNLKNKYENLNKLSSKPNQILPISLNSQTNSSIHKINFKKQCQACDKNQQNRRIQLQKYSLHQNDSSKQNILQQIFKKQNKDQDLFIGENTIKQIKQRQKEKNSFMELKPEQIFKKVIQCGKMNELIVFLQKFHAYDDKQKKLPIQNEMVFNSK